VRAIGTIASYCMAANISYCSEIEDSSSLI
jgi:hypothetical protein